MATMPMSSHPFFIHLMIVSLIPLMIGTRLMLMMPMIFMVMLPEAIPASASMMSSSAILMQIRLLPNFYLLILLLFCIQIIDIFFRVHSSNNIFSQL